MEVLWVNIDSLRRNYGPMQVEMRRIGLPKNRFGEGGVVSKKHFCMTFHRILKIVESMW